jgi:hypothetical protein
MSLCCYRSQNFLTGIVKAYISSSLLCRLNMHPSFWYLFNDISTLKNGARVWVYVSFGNAWGCNNTSMAYTTNKREPQNDMNLNYERGFS